MRNTNITSKVVLPGDAELQQGNDEGGGEGVISHLADCRSKRSRPQG